MIENLILLYDYRCISAIVMYILTKTTKYTVVPIIVMSLTWLLHYKQIKEPSSVSPPSDTPQSTMNSMNSMNSKNSSNVANSAMVESECLLPTKDNPFMQILGFKIMEIINLFHPKHVKHTIM